MADWSALAQLLSGVGDRITLSWSELNILVGGLPPSATNHRAWWSGDRPHVNTWRSAGFALAEVRLGQRVSFVRVGATPTTETNRTRQRVAPRPQKPREHDGGEGAPDLLLLACVQSKQQQPAAAQDLYISPLFRKQRRYAEGTGVPWFILSAEYALVEPHQWLAPYELYLPETTNAYRAAWCLWVAERLNRLAGPLRGRRVKVHGGSAYVLAVRPALEGLGATVTDPLQGLRLGERLAWYDAQVEVPSRPPSALPDVAALTSDLLDRSRAVEPQAFLATGGTDLKRPGLYSWWVNPAGAHDLSVGLNIGLKPGLIYAGLAGATRWPSGKRSNNTLWSRVAGMHLANNHALSTFRFTLAALLSHRIGSTPVDEAALTHWMQEHLRVITVPFDDADRLGEAEEAMLAVLNPPLNLQGMTSTPVRRAVSELRRALKQT